MLGSGVDLLPDSDMHCQVLAMNQAFAEDQEKAVLESDTSSRRLMGQRQNATAAPWNVAQAGHKVTHPGLPTQDF